MNKHRAIKTTVDGIKFDSKLEAKRYVELTRLQQIGHISGLELQVKFELIPKQKGERATSYYADFVYKNEDGEQVVEDTKGRPTPDYIIKRKLMLWVHNIKIIEVKS